ncbi:MULTISPECIES: MAB_1171c family putative transporter [unclassified Streptomyces]|uniref:MAB_1171c family putative transporter n=1 Tax=unclassified Streptomyces TaxID=2593676 RepID=UPI001EF03BBD|nr:MULTISPECIES: MAB_1171c family putative transporter [unclassified Streptomyces]
MRDLRTAWRKPEQRDPALVALAFTYLFSALSYAISLTWVWVRIDGVFGVTNIAVPLAQGCVMLVFGLQASVLAYWTKEPAAAHRRARWMMAGALTVIAIMGVLFVMLTPVSQRPTDFTLYYAHDPAFQAYLLLYMGAYSVAEIYLARVCWKYAGEIKDPWISRGLRLIAVGAVITLGYSGIRLCAILGAEYGFSVKPAEPYAWVCGDVGATLTQIGYFMPIVASRIVGARRERTEARQYQQLEKLWQAVSAAEPGIVFVNPTANSRDLTFNLYRRVIEIRDAQIGLRPYLAPQVRDRAEAEHAAWWMSRQHRVAAVTAAQIRAALDQREHGPVAEAATYGDAALDTSTPHKDLRHMVRVARYFTAPTPTAQAAPASGART